MLKVWEPYARLSGIVPPASPAPRITPDIEQTLKMVEWMHMSLGVQ